MTSFPPLRAGSNYGYIPLYQPDKTVSDELRAHKVTILDDPVDDTDGANKSYVDTATGSTPGGADTSVQYNSSGVFGGDADLTWTGTQLNVNGDAVITGGATADTFTTTSDERYKYAVDPIDSTWALEVIGRVKPCSYVLKKDATGRKRYGVLAQELESEGALCNMVHVRYSQDEEYHDKRSVDYEGFHALCIGAIQALTKKCNDLERQVIYLQNQVD